ncbi:MAG: alpha/beta hydrolase [Bacteroidota bacterium]|nr:alpha/beta hydrolase [Bacteroidota bacterium]
MYCEIYGSGKPLLMIHGNGGSIKSFENNIGFFSKRYKVIVADSRSQGKSRDQSDSISFEMMSDDEAALLDSLHIKKAYVIGWSDGGISALLLAIRYPNKVIKLVSSGANLRPDSTAIIPAQWKKDNMVYEILQTDLIRTFADKNKRKLFMLDFLQPNIPNTALYKIKCPSLIIGGDHDIITIEHTALIYENIPRAYLWIVPDSGHRTMIEHKDEFNKRVDAFFSNSFNNR